MKRSKKIALSVSGAVLAVVLGVAGMELTYLPRYLTHKEIFDIGKAQDDSAITVMSANVRCISPTDLFKKSWFYRAALVVRNVRAASPDIIGFQEVTQFHYSYLTDCLQGYESAITYRNEGAFAEGCPIFYNTSKFTCVENGAFWLSETPDVMSRGWDAAYNRVCSYALLAENAGGKRFVVFNTHLDNRGETARQESIRLILNKIQAFGGMPALIMGDLNAEEDSETYRAATEIFDDAKYRTDNARAGATYQNFGASLNGGNIDYFLISKTGISVAEYRVVTTTYNGVYPSDHFPILLRMTLDG